MASSKLATKHISYTRKRSAEVTRTFDVSTLFQSLDDYPNDTFITTEKFTLEDLNAYILFYPQGNEDAQDGYCSIFVRLAGITKSPKDTRKVTTIFGLGKDHSKQVTQHWRASEFVGEGCGTDLDIAKNSLNRLPIIKVTVRLESEESCIYDKTSVTISDQNGKTVENSEKYGDITLVVKRPISSDEIYIPPNKRRKLNNNASVDMDKKEEEILEEFKASSIILRSASTVFEGILENDMLEKKEQKIIIYSESVQDVKDMIYFMIAHELNKNCNPFTLIHLAHFYGMDRLFWKCVNELIVSVSVNKFVQTLHLFNRYEITKGYTTLIEFAKNNTEEIKKVSDFEKLSHSFKCTILGMGEDYV